MTKASGYGRDWLMIDALVCGAFDEDEREDDVEGAAMDVASSDADPTTVEQLRSALSMAFDRIWRDRLAMTADARHATRAVPLAAARSRRVARARGRARDALSDPGRPAPEPGWRLGRDAPRDDRGHRGGDRRPRGMSSTRSVGGERAAGLAAARAQAAELARRFDVALPVPVEDIAQVLGAEVGDRRAARCYGPAHAVERAGPDPGSRMRWRTRGRGGSASRTDWGTCGSTMAHPAINRAVRSGSNESASARGAEAEANGFAAEMLTPTALIGA